MKNSSAVRAKFRRIDSEVAFQDFNFCGPTDGRLISLRDLGTWAFEARRGDVVAARQFANSMNWTMRQTALNAYHRTHRLQIVSYADWFLSKAAMFVRILLDSDPGTPYLDRPMKGMFRVPDYSDAASLEADHPLFALKPEHDELYDWHGLVRAISEHPEDRDAALLAWLKRPGQTLSARREFPATARRNNLIRQGHADGLSGRQICEILDRNEIPTTKPMQQAGVFRWTVAWNDPDFNGNVRTIFSKATAA
jgi:hypothetical protein